MLKTRSLKGYWENHYSVTVKRTKKRLGRDASRPIMIHFCNYIAEQVLAGEEVYLPKLGTFSIKGKKINYSNLSSGAINWSETRKMWAEDPETKPQMVYHLNEHTNGWYYGLQWKRAKISLGKAYKATSTQAFRKKLYNKIINEQTEYLNT